MQEESVPLNKSDEPEVHDNGRLQMKDGGEDSLINFDDAKYDKDFKASTNPVACCLSIVFPCVWFCSCFSLREQTEIIQLHYGKYSGSFTKPGLQCSNPCGRDLRTISRRKQVVDIPLSKVIDLNGNPLNVSAVVTYYLDNSIRAALAVENSHLFVKTSATSVMKSVVSRYPYERKAGSKVEHDLKTESMVISQEAVDVLQQRVAVAGAKILTFSFNEISYSQEIAANMLKLQQAQALIEARTTIVQGGVDICDHAIHELDRKGIKIDGDERDKLINSLMAVIVGDSGDAKSNY